MPRHLIEAPYRGTSTGASSFLTVSTFSGFTKAQDEDSGSPDIILAFNLPVSICIPSVSNCLSVTCGGLIAGFSPCGALELH